MLSAVDTLPHSVTLPFGARVAFADGPQIGTVCIGHSSKVKGNVTILPFC